MKVKRWSGRFFLYFIFTSKAKPPVNINTEAKYSDLLFIIYLHEETLDYTTSYW
jgi:hypothetical protein